MKRNVLLCFALFIMGFLLAQQPVLLRSAQFLDFEGSKVDLPGGATMVFWNDTSSGSSDVLAQKLSADGNSLWTTPRSMATGPLEQQVKSAILSSDQSIIILYDQFSMSEEGHSFRVQKISQAGQPLWSAEGIAIGDNEDYLQAAILVPNTSGGAYVIYHHSSAVYGMNLDNFGTNLWPHIPLCNFPGTQHIEALDDGAGGVIINNQIYISGEGYQNRLIRFNSAGDVVGSNPLLDPAATVPSEFKMIKDSEGNYILHSLQSNELHLQKMDVNGNLLLPNIVIINDPEQQYYYTVDLKAAPDGGLLYCMLFASGSIDDYFIKLYYLGTNLQPVWAQPTIFPVEGNPNALSLDARDGFWLSWEAWNGTGNDENAAVYCTRIDASGTISFAPQAISNIFGQKHRPIIKALPSRALVIWNDQSTENNSLRCQIITNPGSLLLEPEGRNIYAVLNGNTELKKVHNLGSNYLQIYDDTRYGKNKLYYQLTSANGAPLLDANGRALNLGLSNWEQYLDSALSPHNTTILLYSNYADATRTLWIQEINSEGNTLWPGNGISVATSSDDDFKGSLLGRIGNDLLVVWPVLIPGSYYQSIYGQLFTNGNPQWPASGKLLIDSGNLYSILTAVQEDYLVYIQEDHSNGTMSSRALRIDADGNPYPGWTAGGMGLTPFSSTYVNYQHSGLVNGDLVVFNMLIDSTYIKNTVQKISPDGQYLWGPEGLMLMYNTNWIVYLIDDAVYDNEISFIMHNNDNDEIFLQKLNQAGEMPWGASGCPISSANSIVRESKLIKYANGTTGVFFSRLVDNHFVNLFRQDVSAEGTLIQSEPVAMLGYRAFLSFLKVSSNMNSGLISWNDHQYYERGEAIDISSLWTCRVDASPVSVDDQMSGVPISNLSNYPNPFRDNTAIRFGIKEAAPVQVDIYNLKGQHLRSLLDEGKSAGDYELLWDSKDDQGQSVAAGIYFYKIQAGTFSSRKKMILLK